MVEAFPARQGAIMSEYFSNTASPSKIQVPQIDCGWKLKRVAPNIRIY